MKRLLVLLCLTPLSALAALPAEMSAALQRAGIPESAVSVAVVPLEAPAGARYANADAAVNPASVMKLVTTAASLETLGPNYTWRSALVSDAQPVGGTLTGTVWFKGGGDPKLTIERVWMMLRELRAAGVRDIRGDLVLDRSALRLPPPGAFDDSENDPTRPFLTAPDAALTNFKAVRVRLDSTGGKAVASIEPALPEVRISSTVQIAAGAACPGALQIDSGGDGSRAELRISGKQAPNCRFERWVSVLDAPTYTGSLIRTLWGELGGSWQGKVREGSAPAGATELASSVSPDLTTVIRDINKFSNNLMARQLFLSLGREQGGASHDAAAAAEAVRGWARERQMNWPELVMENGSGLSRKERISARHLAELLAHMDASPFAAEFESSLPIVSIDGTMKKRLKGRDVAAHIKTGTLKDVRAVAGFVRGPGNARYAVVGVINHPAAVGGIKALDALIESVSERGAAEIK
ncbi:D-alanyl-D-alanine carboxypeptidase/D-alanyl-D-alanine endopeptidase [Chitinibacteraceae bacterium HSL-7]